MSKILEAREIDNCYQKVLNSYENICDLFLGFNQLNIINVDDKQYKILDNDNGIYNNFLNAFSDTSKSVSGGMIGNFLKMEKITSDCFLYKNYMGSYCQKIGNVSNEVLSNWNVTVDGGKNPANNTVRNILFNINSSFNISNNLYKKLFGGIKTQNSTLCESAIRETKKIIDSFGDFNSSYEKINEIIKNSESLDTGKKTTLVNELFDKNVSIGKYFNTLYTNLSQLKIKIDNFSWSSIYFKDKDEFKLPTKVVINNSGNANIKYDFDNTTNIIVKLNNVLDLSLPVISSVSNFIDNNNYKITNVNDIKMSISSLDQKMKLLKNSYLQDLITGVKNVKKIITELEESLVENNKNVKDSNNTNDTIKKLRRTNIKYRIDDDEMVNDNIFSPVVSLLISKEDKDSDILSNIGSDEVNPTFPYIPAIWEKNPEILKEKEIKDIVNEYQNISQELDREKRYKLARLQEKHDQELKELDKRHEIELEKYKNADKSIISKIKQQHEKDIIELKKRHSHEKYELEKKFYTDENNLKRQYEERVLDVLNKKQDAAPDLNPTPTPEVDPLTPTPEPDPVPDSPSPDNPSPDSPSPAPEPKPLNNSVINNNVLNGDTSKTGNSNSSTINNDNLVNSDDFKNTTLNTNKKPTITTTTTNKVTQTNDKSSNSGIVGAVLGIGALGAAGVVGARYVKKKKENETYTDDENYFSNDEEFSQIKENDDNESTSKYQAGSMNSLVLDDDSDIDMTNTSDISSDTLDFE